MEVIVEKQIEVDRLRNLPDSLLIQILLNLPTKDVVKTSLLSTKWRNLWRYVPGLELDRYDFLESNDLVRFVDSYLHFNSNIVMQSFKYCNENAEKADVAHVARWINTVVKRKVKHLDLQDAWNYYTIEIPSTLFTCESLVSLTLSELHLPCPEFFALPSLKVMHLIRVSIADSLVLEKLLSNSPVLESLSIRYNLNWDMEVLLVRSHSLLSFVYAENNCVGVEIDAPRLEHLCIDDQNGDTFILHNPASLVKVDISTVFKLGSEKKFDLNDHLKRSMICNFLLGISSVKEMIISSSTLELIYAYSRYEPLPLFRNLAFLRVKFCDNSWESLLFFLESCPNLKSLVVTVQMGFARHVTKGSIGDTLPGTCCLLASLEYVEISTLLEKEAMAMKLVGYLLGKSTILKRLTLKIG